MSDDVLGINNRLNITEAIWHKCGVYGSATQEKKYTNDTVEEFIAFLQNKLLSIPPEYRSNAEIDIDSEPSYEDSTITSITVFYTRPETDDEMTKRVDKENKRQEEIKQKELAQLKELKAKYNG